MDAPTAKLKIPIGQIRDETGEIFVNLRTEPGILKLDTSLHSGKVLAVLSWVSLVCGESDIADTVIVCKDAATLDEYLGWRSTSGRYVAVWRSDKAVVAPQVRVFNG